MANIKALDRSSKKWAERSSVAGPDYSTGIDNPRRPWAQSTLDAEANYKTAVVDAANKGRFGGGVKRAGDARWKMRSQMFGPERFVTGVSGSTMEWEKGFQPYQQAIASLVLPARGPRRSAQNLNRVSAVNKVNGDLKMRMQGGQS